MRTLLTCLGSVLLASQATAQSLAGSWQGWTQPGDRSGEITLTLSRDTAGWHGTGEAAMNGRTLPLRITSLVVNSRDISFHTSLAGADVEFEGKLDGELLLGSLHASENGQPVGAGPWGVARRGDAKSRERLTRWLESQSEAVDEPTQRAVLDAAFQLLRDAYVLPDRIEAAIASVEARWTAGEYQAFQAASCFASELGHDLARALEDRHVRVQVAHGDVPDPREHSDDSIDDEQSAHAAARAAQFGFAGVRVLANNVGYIDVRKLYPPCWSGAALADAMSKVSNADALILDLRECGGGDPWMVALVASWLFDGAPRHLLAGERRMDDTLTQYWTTPWLPGSRFVDKPLIVLTAKRTFSAAEALACVLKESGRARIFGEATGGGAHSGALFPLGEHFAMFVPLSRTFEATTKRDWDGVGVQPDVACDAAKALDEAQRALVKR